MKTDIILAGVGGQGILTIAAAMGYGAMTGDLFLKQAEVHGMSQRGGAVQSHLRISSEEISSDLIPMGHADVVLGVEPMESIRYLSFLNEEGWLITNTKPFENISDYPELEKIYDHIRSLPNHILVDADNIAKDMKAPRSSNIIMLGAVSPFICCLDDKMLKAGITEVFKSKGKDVIEINLKAYEAGKAFALANK